MKFGADGVQMATRFCHYTRVPIRFDQIYISLYRRKTGNKVIIKKSCGNAGRAIRQ